jgi:hypothetical protein
VAYLKKKQEKTGTWPRNPDGYPTGMAALPGLTLLECGVPAKAPEIQRAAKFVRAQAPQLTKTYDLASAILFLDRLGDPKDEKTIRTLALRLVAGQRPSGGWTYECKILTPREEDLLLHALQKRRPVSPLELFVPAPVEKSRSDKVEGLQKPSPEDDKPPTVSKPQKGKSQDANLPDGSKGVEAKPKPPKPAAGVGRADLPPGFRDLPALQPPSQSHEMPEGDDQTTNNSTTQFAVLGLWAAQRHHLPLERALALVVQRFRVSQFPDGGWTYFYLRNAGLPRSPSMTGAGLLGLAVGHGLTADSLPAAEREKVANDPKIEAALKFLSEPIGKPLVKKATSESAPNLYLLWTVERVGVLYNLRSIHGKEWYSWGAAELLAQQESDGSWDCRGYKGATPITDTCFALLFLKRANLSKDLSRKLEFFTIEKKLGDKDK